MDFSSDFFGREHDIIELVTESFTASESAEEGEIVGGLARALLDSTPAADLFVFSALEKANLCGCIFFSRISFDKDDRVVFVLSPVAVKTDQQRRGIGLGLLRHGLEALRTREVEVALTYGSPTYYSKVGFQQIAEDFAQPPFKLSHPHGWLGQSLNGHEFTPLVGQSRCVAALNTQAFW